MIFRFWSYRTFVFRQATGTSDDPALGPHDGLPDGQAETRVRS
jgi:hypothetical protein